LTEAEWLAATEPQLMLEFLRKNPVASGVVSCDCCFFQCRQRPVARCPLYRKLRLFALECCRRILHLLPNLTCQRVAQELELYLEGILPSYARAVEEFDSMRRARFRNFETRDLGDWTALYGAVRGYWNSDFDVLEPTHLKRWQLAQVVASDACRSAGDGEKIAHCHLVRDLFGNPFRPTGEMDPACTRWNGSTVVNLAAAIYQDVTFDSLPVLADALADAGCADAELLGHLRGPGPHVRGCWALDLLLEKK
jgi:hypothetical protein